MSELSVMLHALQRTNRVVIHTDYRGDFAPDDGTMVEVFRKGTPAGDLDSMPPVVRMGFDTFGNLSQVDRDLCHYCN